MKIGKANAEKNNGPKLTIPVKTRTPLEAFQMLRAGQPIDQVAGYYDEEGILEEDFWLMDKLAKLHKLAEYKEVMEQKKMQYDALIKQQDEIEKLNKLNNEKAKQDKQHQEQNNERKVPERGDDRDAPTGGRTRE